MTAPTPEWSAAAVARQWVAVYRASGASLTVVMTEAIADAYAAGQTSILHLIQRHQPAGSPPPGDARILVDWIVRERYAAGQAAERARLRAATWEHECSDAPGNCLAISRDALRDGPTP